MHHKIPQEGSQKSKTAHTHYFINQRSYLNISPTNRQKYLLVTNSDNFVEWIFLSMLRW